ncbi:MAG: alpha/beta fold hydrolase [Myxococcota bacterium]|nr:alpha/beta fold hydrolase [Myxococcota bacterium]
MSGPRWLYLHGFASGPRSKKGVALAQHYAARGVALELLDLRRPSLEHLRLSAMKAELTRALGGPRDRSVVFGSSLGGLTACRVAEEDPRICALVLLAPAFRIAERWRARLGETAWSRWRSDDAMPITDFTTGQPTTVDFGFIEELGRLDAGWPDVRVPTLIVHGVQDDTVDVELSRTWAKGKRHVKLIEVGDGHELTASLPRIISEADRFLAPFLGG